MLLEVLVPYHGFLVALASESRTEPFSRRIVVLPFLCIYYPTHPRRRGTMTALLEPLPGRKEGGFPKEESLGDRGFVVDGLCLRPCRVSGTVRPKFQYVFQSTPTWKTPQILNSPRSGPNLTLPVGPQGIIDWKHHKNIIGHGISRVSSPGGGYLRPRTEQGRKETKRPRRSLRDNTSSLPSSLFVSPLHIPSRHSRKSTSQGLFCVGYRRLGGRLKSKGSQVPSEGTPLGTRSGQPLRSRGV